MAARESLTSKIEATLVAKFGKKMGLWRVGQGAKKVWHAVVVAATARKNCGMTNLWHDTFWSRTKQALSCADVHALSHRDLECLTNKSHSASEGPTVVSSKECTKGVELQTTTDQGRDASKGIGWHCGSWCLRPLWEGKN